MAQPDVQALLTDCRSGDPDKQIAALIELIKLNDKNIVPELLKMDLLSSPDENVRIETVRAFGYLGKQEIERIGPNLLEMLSESSELLRNEIVETLGLLIYPPAVELLKNILHNDPDWIVRCSAAETLGNYKNKELLPDLEQALRDEEPTVQAYAALAIGLTAQPTFLPKLDAYIAAAVTPSVKAELLAAAYRLGERTRLQELLDILLAADEETVPTLLTTFQDLTERCLPPTLRVDIPLLRKALSAQAQRTPLYQAHIQEIQNNLAQLEKAS